MLHEFISLHRDEIIAECRAKVALRRVSGAVEPELEYGVPLFLDQLIDALRTPESATVEMKKSAMLNGGELRRLGVTVAHVVHCYGDVCQSVTEIAVRTQAPITADEFHTFNRCIDNAIAGAVTEFEGSRDRALAADESLHRNERLGVFAHEVRNLLNSATLSYEVLLRGSVGVGGSTGAMLGRSLSGLRALIDRTLSEVRLSAGLPVPERVMVAELIEEIEIYAVLEAQTRGLRLSISSGARDLYVDVDRQILSSVLTNLVQNAMKFSHPDGLVMVQVLATRERVLIEVRDECGGLPPGRAEGLFQPFEQRSADKTGLGLGLAICYEGVQANGGTIHVSNLPGTGCVFTVDFPRATSNEPAEATVSGAHEPLV
jgi:signal transduction histidine kinase